MPATSRALVLPHDLAPTRRRLRKLARAGRPSYSCLLVTRRFVDLKLVGSAICR